MLTHLERRRIIAVVRRVYSVGSPNEVWQYDGNHKLIHWRLVLHGCVDGYSRVITYLHCSTNNRASTILSLFTKAVEQYGLPQKVRSDLGGENVDVWRFMIVQHNDERAVITGSSTPNERIEPLWRDVFRCVGKLFYELFFRLEDEAALDPLNETDVFCLHYVFLPSINKCLKDFNECWNNHNISSENNYTPYQLFLVGRMLNVDSSSMQNVNHVPIPASLRVSETVTVPRSTFSPCQQLKALLALNVNPLTCSSDLGYSMYRHRVFLVGNHVSMCVNCTCLSLNIMILTLKMRK